MERWGMLNGTEAGRWISLLVRQKRPLPGKGTGGIGDLKVSLIDVLTIGLWHGYGLFIISFPNFLCDQMIVTPECDYGYRFEFKTGFRNVKVVFAGGLIAKITALYNPTQ